MKAQFSFSTVLFCLVLAWISTAPVAAQIAFGPQQVIVNGKELDVRSVYTADLDGDGLNDLLALIDMRRMVWFRNTGMGNFDTYTYIYVSPNNIGLISLSDIDDDGDIDIIFSSFGLQLIKNEGAGLFAEAQNVISMGMSNFHLSDVNADGLNDIIFSTIINLYWSINNGNGTFSTPMPIEPLTMGNKNIIKAADINSDGYLDFVANLGSALVWYAGTASGFFEPHQTIEGVYIYPTGLQKYLLELTDVDGDGNTDVVYFNNATKQLLWLANDGNGNFATPQSIYSFISTRITFELIDFNYDGFTDILITEYLFASGTEVKVLLGNGVGNYTEQFLYTYSYDQLTVIPSDFNNDGLIDFVSLYAKQGKISCYEHLPDLSFVENDIFQPIIRTPNAAYPVDVDADGFIDVLTFSVPSSTIAYCRNNGNGSFTLPITIKTGEFTNPDNLECSENGTIVYAGYEIDENYFQIIYTGPNGISIIKDALNDPYNSTSVITDTLPFGCKMKDIDNDGDLDLVAQICWGLIVWYANDGFGNFSFADQIDNTSIGLYYHYVVEDVNNDGYLDFLATSGSEGIVAYRNDGANNFSYMWIGGSLGTNSRLVSAADVTGDGHIDLVIEYDEQPGIRFSQKYFIDSYWYFEVTTTLDIGSSYYNVGIADIDDDGHTDILFSSNANKLFWRKNTGSGNFAAKAELINNFTNSNPLQFVDLDNDGDLDLLSFQGYSHAISWYENLLETVSIAPTLPDAPTAKPLHISPNPTQNTATLTYTTSPQTQPTTLHLYDLTGRLLFDATLQPTAGINSYVLDMTRYPQGVYVVTLNSGADVVTGKVVRE